jgi:tetratricopeptide (TPR) repeat protein
MNLTAGRQLYEALEIDLDRVPLELFDKYIAIEYFLTREDEFTEDVENLKKVDRYLQTFHHLCEASELQKASKVLSFCPISKELHEQLRIWGYYREQIELYQNLLGKVSTEQDLVCLNGLGRAYYNLSDFDKSWDYHQQQLHLAHQVNNRQAEGLAIAGLGEIQRIKGNRSEAIALFQQQLDIAREIGDLQQECYALNGLGYALYDLGLTRNKQNYHREGLSYLQESLEIARKLGDLEMESSCLYGISQAYLNRGEYEQVFIFMMQQLDICDKANDKRSTYIALERLQTCCTMSRKYDQAIHYGKEALRVIHELGDKLDESGSLNNLGIIYCYKLQRYQEALPYFEKALEIMHKINVKGRAAILAVNAFNCHFFLKNMQDANFYLNMAKSFAAESDSLEDKGLVTMAIANVYWGRKEIWYKVWAIILGIKSLIIIPPWRSANGKMAMQEAIKVVFGIKIRKNT